MLSAHRIFSHLSCWFMFVFTYWRLMLNKIFTRRQLRLHRHLPPRPLPRLHLQLRLRRGSLDPMLAATLRPGPGACISRLLRPLRITAAVRIMFLAFVCLLGSLDFVIRFTRSTVFSWATLWKISYNISISSQKTRNNFSPNCFLFTPI